MEENDSVMKWVWLCMAIVFEVCGTTSMKLSDGFSRWIPSVCMFAFYGASLVALNVALKQIPVSVAYAIWSGLGMVLISSIGVLYFKEPLSAIQMTSIALVVIGVAGLNLGSIRH